jgi:hypothetical protein
VSTDPTTPAPPANGTTPAFPDHPDWSGPQRFALFAAITGLAIYLVAGIANLSGAGEHNDAAKSQFFLSYLCGYVYWLSLPVGGMALLMIHYLAKTSWGILLKRPIEAATRTLPLMFVLAIPLIAAAFMEKASPYWWSDPHRAQAELKAQGEAAPPDANPRAEGKSALSPADERRAEQQRKADAAIRRAVAHEVEEREKGTFGFLTPVGFTVCLIIYFAIWGLFIFFFNKWSRDIATDHAKVEPSLEKAKNISGPGLIIFAIVNTAAASHLVMSLEPSWASTMFPVIYTINSFLTCFCFCVALFLSLASRPPLANILRPKFQIDMGSLMLAFTLFWTYTSFSQMMLVWIGNLPEEIPFYLKRSAGGWWYVSAVLIVFHFALPFLLLLFRDIKMHPKRLRAVAIYLLVMCAVDVMWWITPALPHEGQYLFALMDVGAVIGIGGVWGIVFLWQLRQRPLVPQNEIFWLPAGHHDETHDAHNGGHH